MILYYDILLHYTCYSISLLLLPQDCPLVLDIALT